MGSLVTPLEGFLYWLFRATWQASLLICLILLIQRVAGHRLGGRGRHCLWLVLLIRLAMPWAPPSRVSVYNLLPGSALPGYARPVTRAVGNGATISMGDGASQEARVAASTSGDGQDTESRKRPASPTWFRPNPGTTVLISLLWLAGACLVGGHIVVSNARLRRVVRSGCPVTDARILGLLGHCQRLIGARGRVRVIATDRIGSPAQVGFIRPCLLLPGEMRRADSDDLRYVFLHELAHWKRHDVFVGHLVSLLHVLHWFNPLVGFGFHRMRADRESACDGLALSVLDADEVAAYGHTIVRQIERLLASRWRPMPMAVCGVRSRIRHRIAMIARFHRKTYQWSPPAVVLIGLLACVALTDGRAGDAALRVERASPEAASVSAAEAVAPLGHAPARIVRVHLRHKETGRYLVAGGGTVACDVSEPGEAGLWEARFDGSLGHGGDAFLYSVSDGTYLASDAQGNLSLLRRSAGGGAARWIVWARPDGVWVVSRECENGYLRADEQGRVRAVTFGRDDLSYWDIVPLEAVK